MRILIAYDGSPTAEAAVDQVIARPWAPGTEIRLVTVLDRVISVPPPDGIEVYAPLMEKMRASLREEAYRHIRQALSRLESRPELTASYEMRNGGVKEGLLDAIKEWSADLVLVGSRGGSPLARLILGSVSHALAAHAPCNVEIVRSATRG